MDFKSQKAEFMNIEPIDPDSLKHEQEILNSIKSLNTEQNKPVLLNFEQIGNTEQVLLEALNIEHSEPNTVNSDLSKSKNLNSESIKHEQKAFTTEIINHSNTEKIPSAVEEDKYVTDDPEIKDSEFVPGNDGYEAEKDEPATGNDDHETTKDKLLTGTIDYKAKKGEQDYANDAQESEKDAQESEKDAQDSEKDAQESGKDAQESEKDAQDSKKDAQDSEKDAQDSEKDAQDSEKDAQESEDDAQVSGNDVQEVDNYEYDAVYEDEYTEDDYKEEANVEEEPLSKELEMLEQLKKKKAELERLTQNLYSNRLTLISNHYHN